MVFQTILTGRRQECLRYQDRSGKGGWM